MNVLVLSTFFFSINQWDVTQVKLLKCLSKLLIFTYSLLLLILTICMENFKKLQLIFN